MSELMDLRLHHQLAQEIYRHQMMQRLPDPYQSMLPLAAQRHLPLPIPTRMTLPGVEAKLQNANLWSQFHDIGTEMIITKSGRRMFPSLRLSLNGLEDDVDYCVLLEMVPIGDCRYKFSGSQWVPAGGAEPQSAQRMYLHPDSPANGSHWSQQPILFNKVKLTNNTLDNSGHIVLTSMHKYMPRIHIIRTSDPSQIPWAPQKSCSFSETEFIAVTAYQNDRITKLKIDNNPFAKGFRETGQSRCKRKLVPCSPNSDSPSAIEDIDDSEAFKRLRLNSSRCSISSLDDSGVSVSGSSSGTTSPMASDSEIIRQAEITQQQINQQNNHHHHHHHQQTTKENLAMYPLEHQFVNPLASTTWMEMAFSYFSRASYPPFYPGYEVQPHFSGLNHPLFNLSDLRTDNDHTSPHFEAPGSPILGCTDSNEPIAAAPKKSCGFTISEILGCES